MRLYWFFTFVSLSFADSFSQGKLFLQIVDLDHRPFQNIDVVIVQLQIKMVTDLNGQCKFSMIPEGIYAMAINYLYDVEYRTLYMPAHDTTILVQLERRVNFEEILIKSYQLGIAEFANATSIGAQSLQDLYKEKDIPYVLAGAPGVFVSSDAGNGVGYTGLRFRGLDPSHIQLTINGIPFTDAESSLSYFVDIPDILSNSENISLIRGNVPNRPGTPSFGGAIDIQTNHLKFEPGARTELQYGSYNTYKFSGVAHSGLLENKFYFEAGLSQMKSDGYIDRSEAKLNSFHLAAGIVNKKNAFRLNYIHGSEKTGQAWFGLPVQYKSIDSLRSFNAAGMEKQSGPYENEIDDYKQDHLQFFYQQQFSDLLTWSNTLNYTHGSGYYENYKAQTDLKLYEINGFGNAIADIVRQKWLENDYIFLRSELLVNLNKTLELRPEVSFSFYNGRHFGRVKDVILDSFDRNKKFYYENEGAKLDGSVGFKLLWKPISNWDINLDLLYRDVKHEINGFKEFNLPIQYELHFNAFTPKIFIANSISKNWSLFTSVGYMQREPFREDILIGDFKNTSEELIDFEIGMQFMKAKSIKATLNGYYMYYPSLRGLSGALSDVGEPLFINLRKVSNLGLEWTVNFSFGNGYEVSNASALSYSKIPEWTESYLKYSEDWSSQQLEHLVHLNTRLAYHPNFVSHSELTKKFEFRNLSFKSLEIKAQHQFITDYYLDNSSRLGSRLDGYSIFHIGISMDFAISQKSSLDFWFDVQNLFNEDYSGHGWISRFGYEGDLDIKSDPYLGKEDSGIYHYKALFPQAFRHFRTGLSLNF